MKKIFLTMIVSSVLLLADYSRINDIVIDSKTGLQWQDNYKDNGNIKQLTWKDAIAYCEGLTLDGYDDWRLPNIYELRSIVEHSRYDPAIAQMFQHITSHYYWSSTTSVHITDSAWGVSFWDGKSHYYKKNLYSYVRCVRDGQ